jgi:hypothetical protein
MKGIRVLLVCLAAACLLAGECLLKRVGPCQPCAEFIAVYRKQLFARQVLWDSKRADLVCLRSALLCLLAMCCAAWRVVCCFVVYPVAVLYQCSLVIHGPWCHQREVPV